MIWIALFIAAAGTTGAVICYLAFDAAGYRPLRRAIERGEIDVAPSRTVRQFRASTLTANPDVDNRYLVFDIPPGKIGVLTGRVAPTTIYTSITVYDELLQSVPPSEGWGPTMLTERDLDLDADGNFEVVLAHEDRGWTDVLDISATPKGVLLERHIGAPPQTLTTIELRDA